MHSLEKIAKKRDALINPGSPQYGSAIKLIIKGGRSKAKRDYNINRILSKTKISGDPEL